MLPAVLRRGAGLPLARGAAGAATWHKPQVGLELPQPGDARLRTVTVLPGDGVGPEVIKSAQEAIAATGAPRRPPAPRRRRGTRASGDSLRRLPPRAVAACNARSGARRRRGGGPQRRRALRGAAGGPSRAEAGCT